MHDRRPAQESMTSRGLSRIGVVVHPSRDVDRPLQKLRDWSIQSGVDVFQVPGLGQQREVARLAELGGCDLIVSIGGDGTMLAATRAAAHADRPVLGVACGSLGMLTTVGPDDVGPALERISRGDWVPVAIPGLVVARGLAETPFALNDISIVRAGVGQLRTSARIDDVMFARFAGDGCVVSTPAGSSGYALAAGGPLLPPRIDGFLLTPVSPHGGCCPPIVIDAGSELRLDLHPGFGGARLEIDGQVIDASVGSLTIGFRPGVATVVGFDDQEPWLTRLQLRGIIIDSPRILADDERS